MKLKFLLQEMVLNNRYFSKITKNIIVEKIAIYDKNDYLITTPPLEDIPYLLKWNELGLMKDTNTPKIFNSKVIKRKIEDKTYKVAINIKTKYMPMKRIENFGDFRNSKFYYDTYNGKEYIEGTRV